MFLWRNPDIFQHTGKHTFSLYNKIIQCISIESLIINILYSFEIIGKSKKKKKKFWLNVYSLKNKPPTIYFFKVILYNPAKERYVNI